MSSQRRVNRRQPTLILFTDQPINLPSPITSPNSSSPKNKLHLFSPRVVADELTLMDAELLRRISPKELEGCAWMKHDKNTRAPNIMSMVRASNNLALLVPSEILSEGSTSAMARCITMFIKIASQCYRQNNLNSLKAILAGLQCTPIYRLKQTWKEVPSKWTKKFHILSQLTSEEYNWMAYRNHLNKLLEETTPCIPFLGVLLSTAVQHDSSRNGCRPRRVSGVENYTVLEAITVRNKLERLSTNWRKSLPPWLEQPCHRRQAHTDCITTTMTILGDSESKPSILSNSSSEGEDSDSDYDCEEPSLDVGGAMVMKGPTDRRRIWSEALIESEEEAPLEILRSRSFDGLKDAFTSLDLYDEEYSVVRVPSIGSLSSTCTSSASSGESSSSLPITATVRPLLASPPPLSPEPSFELPSEMRIRANDISETREKRLSLDVPTKRPSSLSQCSVDIPPQVLNQRRRPSTLLSVLHSSTIPTEQLARYQFLSLGCSTGIHGNPELRAIIIGDYQNTEGRNYRLSYLREPA